MPSARSNSYLATRPLILGLSKIFFLSLTQIPFVRAVPIHASTLFSTLKDEEKDADDTELWLYLSVAAALVILGGAFAGLTIALMGQVSPYICENRQWTNCSAG
jgi:metal transporter CNNM